jgi:hypothetical protein
MEQGELLIKMMVLSKIVKVIKILKKYQEKV